jgi:hypothetical protein
MNMKSVNRLLGYARVSKDKQELQLQTDALLKAGVSKQLVFVDKVSGPDVTPSSCATSPYCSARWKRTRCSEEDVTNSRKEPGDDNQRVPVGSENSLCSDNLDFSTFQAYLSGSCSTSFL